MSAGLTLLLAGAEVLYVVGLLLMRGLTPQRAEVIRNARLFARLSTGVPSVNTGAPQSDGLATVAGKVVSAGAPLRSAVELRDCVHYRTRAWPNGWTRSAAHVGVPVLLVVAFPVAALLLLLRQMLSSKMFQEMSSSRFFVETKTGERVLIEGGSATFLLSEEMAIEESGTVDEDAKAEFAFLLRHGEGALGRRFTIREELVRAHKRVHVVGAVGRVRENGDGVKKGDLSLRATPEGQLLVTDMTASQIASLHRRWQIGVACLATGLVSLGVSVVLWIRS